MKNNNYTNKKLEDKDKNNLGINSKEKYQNSKKTLLDTKVSASKSKSVSKMPVMIDKEEIYREFFAKKNSKSTGKLINNKSGTLDKSMSNTSRPRLSKGSNLIPIRTVKVKHTNKSVNLSQSDYNRKIDLNNSSVSIKSIESSSKGKIINNNYKMNYNSDNKEFVETNSKSRIKLSKKVNVYDLHNAFSSSNSNQNNINQDKTESSKEFISTEKNINFKQIEKDNLIKEILNKNANIINHIKKDSYLDENNNSQNKSHLRASIRKSDGENNSKIQNENYEKYCQHLLDQITFLEHKNNEYKLEKDKLLLKLDESKNDKFIYVEQLEKDIRSYKTMTDSCMKTCSLLAEEIMLLKSEISIYTNFNEKESSSFHKGNNNKNNKNINISYGNGSKSEKITSKIRSVSPIRLKLKK